MAHRRTEGAESDIVKLYLSEIGKYPLLDRPDELRLAQAIETGHEATASLRSTSKLSPAKRKDLGRLIVEGKAAQKAFVRSNLRLVVSIAKHYQASGLPLLDLVQEGNLGLIHAVEKFDWRKGFKFSTYATWWIRQAISRGISNTGRTVRIPVHAMDKLMRVTQARAALEVRLGRPATLDELASEATMTRGALVEALRWGLEPLSLSDPLSEDGDTNLGDIIGTDVGAASPFDHAASSLLPNEINRLFESLDQREATILRMRFGLDCGEPRTLEEVGEYFHLTRERIRQLEAKAMSKLRHPSLREGARGLLEGS
jgi:RNA polymerase sigma factor (sigma-70 family)